jgi:hypothetical protein
MLARYDQLGLIERLRERVGRRTASGAPEIHGLWILVPTPDHTAMPVLDNRAIPVVTPGQWARISRAWLANLHRSAPAATP